ncbi:putative transmembrane protein 183BP [Lytechinus pictus]|uniref:putative transmembrane protein 183BP n=1 Tax=Lytechinus pictus TaxID=7653 RepID=UPI0030B9DA18
MPRRSKQRIGRNSGGYLNQADFKLGDFADNPAARLPLRVSKKSFRMKYDTVQIADMREETASLVKSKLMTQEEDSKAEEKMEKKEKEEDLAWDERDWDEKDSSDFETDASYSTHQQFDDENEEEGDKTTRKKSRKGSKKKGKAKLEPVQEGTRVYPIDLWYILADYVRPEDIATFSCLCKDAYSITRTVSFWKKLYFRYLNPNTVLPPYLKPEGIERTHGLCAFVIRALYFLHEPYRLSLNKPCPVGEGHASPEAIKDYTCLYTWSSGRMGHHFTHFMKLRLCSKEGAVVHKGNSFNKDIFANDNRRECILRVHCESFQDVPSGMIMGLQLLRASVSVSANMRYHKVRLEFGRKDRRGFCVKSSVIMVVLDPVLKVDVLQWWHPQFRECSQRSIDKAFAQNVANLRENIVWEGL